MVDSFPQYKAGWVHRDICARLERFSKAVIGQQSPRLMLFMPPRHGKSFLVSERFPVWHLGRHPEQQILLASYGQTLSDKFSKRARSLAKSPITLQTFPKLKLDPERQAITEWETTEGGAYRAVGIGGGATGTGCDILIIDDPIKNAMEANSKTKRENDWEWYQTTAYTRLMPGGGVLVIQTRWHEDDLSGRLIKAMKNGDGDDWEIAVYPAIAEQDDEFRQTGEALHPVRYDIKKLDAIKRTVGTRTWNSLYQQRPSAIEGSLFKKTWWKFYTETPKRFERLVQSWDCNFKGGVDSDYVVGSAWGKLGADYYLLDQVRGKWDFIETIEQVKKFAMKWYEARPILIEDAANGPAVISSLKGKISGIVAFQPKGSKEARATIVTPLAEAGNIHLPQDAKWLQDFIDETASFPRGINDDQIDSMTQAIIHLEEEGKLSVFENISAAFGNPPIYPASDWVTSVDGPREVFIGAKWGASQQHAHTFYALGTTGATMGYQRLFTANPQDALNALKQFVRKLAKATQPTIFYESTGFGETMSRLIDSDTTMDWRTEPVKIIPNEIGSMVAYIKESIAEGKLALKPWSILFDQLASFRCEETERGSLIFGPPDGLSANAVFALMLAHEGWRTYQGEIGVAVINEVEKTLTRIYYGGGSFDDLD